MVGESISFFSGIHGSQIHPPLASSGGTAELYSAYAEEPVDFFAPAGSEAHVAERFFRNYVNSSMGVEPGSI
jgi:hypothetical protein